MKVVCTLTKNYLPLALPYLCSARKIKSSELFCVCYKFEVSEGVRKAFPHFNFVTLGPVATESFNMIQHGRFLDAFDFGSNELICLTDTDIFVQRDFRQNELEILNSFDNNDIGAYYNAHCRDCLDYEATRLKYTGDVPDGEQPIYNCGVMVGRADIFRRVQEEYEKDCFDFYSKTNNRSRCQFQFWRAWHRMPGVKQFRLLPKLIHQHGHYGRQPFSLSDEELEQVMFRHKI